MLVSEPLIVARSPTATMSSGEGSRNFRNTWILIKFFDFVCRPGLQFHAVGFEIVIFLFYIYMCIYVYSMYVWMYINIDAYLRAAPPAAGPLSTGNCWQVDCWNGLPFQFEIVILETLRVFFGYLGHHFGDPGVQGDTQWTHWGPDVRFYRF